VVPRTRTSGLLTARERHRTAFSRSQKWRDHAGTPNLARSVVWLRFGAVIVRPRAGR
jgi:hypothetical protein